MIHDIQRIKQLLVPYLLKWFSTHKKPEPTQYTVANSEITCTYKRGTAKAYRTCTDACIGKGGEW